MASGILSQLFTAGLFNLFEGVRIKIAALAAVQLLDTCLEVFTQLISLSLQQLLLALRNAQSFPDDFTFRSRPQGSASLTKLSALLSLAVDGFDEPGHKRVGAAGVGLAGEGAVGGAGDVDGGG